MRDKTEFKNSKEKEPNLLEDRPADKRSRDQQERSNQGRSDRYEIDSRTDDWFPKHRHADNHLQKTETRTDKPLPEITVRRQDRIDKDERSRRRGYMMEQRTRGYRDYCTNRTAESHYDNNTG